MKYRKNSVKGRGFERGATTGHSPWGSEWPRSGQPSARSVGMGRVCEQMRAMLYGPETAMQRMTKAVKV